MKIFRILLSACGIYFAFTSVSYAGTISGSFSNSSDLSKYTNFSKADNFPYSGGLLINGQVCSGTLIQKQWVLTAGHCLYKNPGATVTSGKFLLSDGLFEANVVGGVAHKSWENAVDTNLQAALGNRQYALYDIALLKLDRDATLFTQRPLPQPSKNILGPLDKFVGSLVGFGKKGDGTIGALNNADPRTVLGGQNRISIIGDGTLNYDLDRIFASGATNPTTNIDNLDGVPLEFLPSSGDSGGSIFLGNELVGIHSRSGPSQRCRLGNCLTFDKSKYGSLGFGTPVAKYAGWIANVIYGYPSTNNVRSRATTGNKVEFTAGGYPFDLLDADVEVDDSYLPLEFDVTNDTFSDDLNEDIFDNVFNSNIPTEPVPEPTSILGVVTLGSIFAFLKRKISSN